MLTWVGTQVPSRLRVSSRTVRCRPSVAGTARLLDDDEAVRVRALLAGKYPWLHGRLVPAVHRRKGWRTLHYELELR